MPLREVTINTDAYLRFISRVLIVGPPWSWKTSSLATWLDEGDEGDVHAIVMPGERGTGALPAHPRFHVYECEWGEKDTAESVVKEVSQLVVEVVAKPHQALQLDGLHKLHTTIHDKFVAQGGGGDEARLRAYDQAHREFREILGKAARARRFVGTVWDGWERDRPDEVATDNPKKVVKRYNQHLWPGLPGQMAKMVVGEFGVVVRAVPGKQLALGSLGRYSPGTWITKETEEALGLGVRVPAHLGAAIPPRVRADWRRLERFLTELLQTGKADSKLVVEGVV